MRTPIGEVKQQPVSYSTSGAYHTQRGDTPVGVSPWTCATRLVVLGALTGLALGALTRWVDNLPDGWRSLALIGAPWLGLAFLLGAFAVLWGARSRVAAVVGAVATVGAVLGYYGYMRIVEHEANAYYLAHYLTFWLVPALLGGPLFGAAGAVWRGGHGPIKAGAVGLLSAVCVGEGGWETLRLLSTSFQRQADVVNVAELALGLALPLVLLHVWRDRLLAYGTIAVFALIGAACLRLIATLLAVFT